MKRPVIKRPYFSSHPLIFIGLILILIFGLLTVYTLIAGEKAKVGGPEVKIINKTNSTVKVYSDSEHRYIAYNVISGEKRTLGPFKNYIGPAGTSIKLEGDRWDRPVLVEFKGKETSISKKLVEDRKSRFSGTVRTIKVDMSWPLFSSHFGYNVTLTEF